MAVGDPVRCADCGTDGELYRSEGGIHRALGKPLTWRCAACVRVERAAERVSSGGAVTERILTADEVGEARRIIARGEHPAAVASHYGLSWAELVEQLSRRKPGTRAQRRRGKVERLPRRPGEGPRDG